MTINRVSTPEQNRRRWCRRSRPSKQIKSIVLVVSFLMLGAGVGAPGNNLHAEECLSAPDSPSPQGTHWHYRLDWATQRKCWYLRAPARSLRRAAAAATATATPAPPEHQEECLSAPDFPSPQGTHWRYRLDWPTQRKCWYLGAPARSVLAQNPIAIPTNIPADSASFDARTTHNNWNSMATILAVLALVLAALCVVVKNGATRRASAIIGHRERDDQRQRDCAAVKINASMKGSYWYQL